MPISDSLLEIKDHTQEGYRPLVDYGAWRVAILNPGPDLLPENLTAMQRHLQTDEVFVLLRGRCILFIGEGDDTITSVQAEDMSLFKLYNVKQAVWHTHTLSQDAMVLIVENKDTTFDNSPFCPLGKDLRAKILDLTRSLWAPG
jgi:hypothetical protein